MPHFITVYWRRRNANYYSILEVLTTKHPFRFLVDYQQESQQFYKKELAEAKEKKLHEHLWPVEAEFHIVSTIKISWPRWIYWKLTWRSIFEGRP